MQSCLVVCHQIFNDTMNLQFEMSQDFKKKHFPSKKQSCLQQLCIKSGQGWPILLFGAFYLQCTIFLSFGLLVALYGCFWLLSQNFGRWLGSYEWYFVILWIQVQWWKYHDVLGTIKLLVELFSLTGVGIRTLRVLALAPEPPGETFTIFWKKVQLHLCPPPLNMLTTRMHSSGMRTARLLPVSPSMHCSGGCTCWGCVPGPGGCTCLGGVPGPWGVYLVPGGVPAQGVYLVRGGVYLPRYSPCEQNDRQV